jgi:acetyl-CoA carboxylase carboxyl transferase alpha subunit
MVDRLLGRPAEAAKTETADPKELMWRRVQLARNLARPRTLDLLAEMADEVIELHGDRGFGDDPAMAAGFARIDGRRIAFVGQQKGADTDENIRRNFGMPHPEGYRKSMRIMELAERFGLPIVTFVDVPGAHPGPESEERGIAEAIARSIGLMSRLRTPIVAIITGEGGSGGALAVAVGDVVVALENAVYSVISPEPGRGPHRCPRDEDVRPGPARARRHRPGRARARRGCPRGSPRDRAAPAERDHRGARSARPAHAGRARGGQISALSLARPVH